MTRILFSFILLIFSCGAFSQHLSHVIISQATTLSSFSFTTDQKVIIRISPDGRVLEWGEDAGTTRYGTYIPGRLQPYMGRVEYYRADEYDSLLRGKVRSIGTTSLTYYPTTETPEKAGKLRAIGSVLFEYYSNFDNEAIKGKLKLAGNILLDYYSAFENEAFRGKLKTVGNNTITYYSTFDDKLIRGKIKTLGSITYTWLDRGFRNGWSNVSYTPIVNGITYLLY